MKEGEIKASLLLFQHSLLGFKMVESNNQMCQTLKENVPVYAPRLPPSPLFPSVNSSSIFGCEFVANAKELVHRLIYIHVQPSVIWRVCQRPRFVVK